MSDAPPPNSPRRFAATLLARARRAVALLMVLNLGVIAMTLVTPLLTGWAVERADETGRAAESVFEKMLSAFWRRDR